MGNEQKKKNKSAPRSTGKRKAKILTYYELRYPERKLRRIWHDTGSVAALRKWADHYKTPSGMSANGTLVKVAKALGINLQQVG